MDAANLHKSDPAAGRSELVLQNGRQAGARRPLGTPTTFIGRNPGCDVRLNVDGVEPMHCLLIVDAEGVRLRDLASGPGTFINEERVDNVVLRNGDMLRVGPFQFRVELSPPVPAVEKAPIEHHAPNEEHNPPIEEHRAALRVQAAAVAAQQVALEEEEARLQQRRHDLAEQEEQLAAHLAERQRQVQVWSDYTNAECEALRKQKIEQEKHLNQLEQEVIQAKEKVNQDHHKLTQERHRIDQVYRRLRQRWQKQWSAEREKYQKYAAKLEADTLALDERQNALNAQDAAWKRDVLQFNSQRELATRQLQESRDNLAHDQARWRRRRSHEFVVLKGIQRKTDEAQIKLKQARQLLLDEKAAWDRQVDALQKELHGLNNRIIHQRCRAQEQAEEIARLEAILRDRQAEVSATAAFAAEIVPADAAAALPEYDVVIVTEGSTIAGAPVVDWRRRFEGLDILAGELADQRLHLIEQYQSLAQLQDDWQRRRDHAATELEALAQRLVAQEETLHQRERHSDVVEATLQQKQQEIDAIRQEIQIWRVQLKTQEQVCADEHAKQLQTLREQDALLKDQLAGLAQLRQRWSERRQHETEQLRTKLAAFEEENRETQRRRVAIFERGQQLDEEKRILAGKAMALEQYRQEFFLRAQDPAAQRRVERLRRRWLTLNSTQIRNARAERDATRRELHKLEAERAELVSATSQLLVSEAAAAAQQALLDEREAILKDKEGRVEQDLARLEQQRQDGQEQRLRLQNEIDTLAQAVYDDPENPPIEQAA